MKVPGHSLTVLFVNAGKMRDLNRQYRGKDYATDVLSFSYPDETVDGAPFLGEIVIAPEIAWRQACRWKSGIDREIRRLLVHGILHLLGFDHEMDGGEMNRIQQQLVRSRAFLRGDPVATVRVER
jgi:probable rRNA maturation factor